MKNKRLSSFLGIEPNIGDIITFNPPRYKGLKVGYVIGFTSVGLPKLLTSYTLTQLKIDYDKFFNETFTEYLGDHNSSHITVPKTGFEVIHQTQRIIKMKNLLLEYVSIKIDLDEQFKKLKEENPLVDIERALYDEEVLDELNDIQVRDFKLWLDSPIQPLTSILPYDIIMLLRSKNYNV